MKKLSFAGLKGRSVLGQCFRRCHDCIGNIRVTVYFKFKYWFVYV